MEKEDGEMSDDNAMLVDDIQEKDLVTEKESNSTVLYKAGKNGVVVERLEKIDASKIEERAKRFGLNLTGNRLVTQTQIDELYVRSGIESGNERHFRFDALHLNGIEGLTTKDIFEYLEDYKPVSLERVDDKSCNVVCQDHISAALALLVHSREIKNEEINKMLADKSNHHWREGMPHPKKDLILMRFATNGDKKVVKKKADTQYSEEYYDESMDMSSKNPWGDLCKSWGVYDHQEIFQRRLPKDDFEDDIDDEVEEPQVLKLKNKRLAMRLGKRNHKIEKAEDSSSSDSDWKKKSKAPRMRMHADDEETKQQKKIIQPEVKRERDRSRDVEKESFAPLSIEVINSRSSYTPRQTTKLSDKFKRHTQSDARSKKDNILSRLGARVIPSDVDLSSDEFSSDSSDHNIMSRVQKVNSVAINASSVWSRLETKQTKESSQSDLRQILKTRKDKKSDDLRERITKSKKKVLRIEIDNNFLSD